MFYFIAQTTNVATELTSESVGIWTSFMEGAAKWGLGIVLAVLVMALLFLIVKKVLKNVDDERTAHADDSKQERELFLKLLEQKDLTINNHLAHVQGALGNVEKSQVQLSETFIRCTDKIVAAIDHQTDILTIVLPEIKKEKK